MKINKRRAAWVVLAMMASAVAVYVLSAILISAENSETVVDRQRTNTGTINDAAETLTIIKDCTQPGGKCYERSQRQTGEAVQSLNQVTIDAAAYAAACANDGIRGAEPIRRCVLAEFERRDVNPMKP